MSHDVIMGVLSDAARRHATVALSIDIGASERRTEVEPYSVLKRAGVLTLFCWDTGTKQVTGLPVDKLVRAAPTMHEFTPRYEIEF